MSQVRWVDGQAFAPFDEWECYRSGFHAVPHRDNDAEQSAALYQDIPRLRSQCQRVLSEWPITSAVHISQHRNHQAWMGHAACFLSHGAGMLSSIAAYWMLDDSGRDGANRCVMEAVNMWKRLHATFLPFGTCPGANDQLALPFSPPLRNG